MKHPILALTITLIALMSSTTMEAQKDVKADIIEANARFVALFAAGDATAFVEGMYTEDAVVMPPNSPAVTGKDNLIGMWGSMMEAGIMPKVMTNTALAHGKTAIEDGTVEIYSGDTKVDEAKYIVIWKKEGKTWKMHKDIWNSSMPIQ